VILAANPSDQESLAMCASLGIQAPAAPTAKTSKPAVSSPVRQLDGAGSASESAVTPAAPAPPARHQAGGEKLEQWLRFIQTRRRDRPPAVATVPTSHA